MNPLPLLAQAAATPVPGGRLLGPLFRQEPSVAARLVLIVLLALLSHLVVKAVGAVSERIVATTQRHRSRLRFMAQQPKLVTLIRLVANTVIWVVYFVATGLFLEECGVNLTAYLASASVVGLAISFGSQGLVQDMVIGLTLIFSDAMDVDDMVEIVGSATVVGRVQEIGLRFTKVVNLYNQVVFIPNRTVANVSRFPQGGIHAYADIQFPAGVDGGKAIQVIRGIAHGVWRQFGAIVLEEPVIDSVQTTQEGGWEFLRIRFLIWPGQGSLIETTFRQQVLKAMRGFEPTYADWQVTVLYRVLGGEVAATPGRGTHEARPAAGA